MDAKYVPMTMKQLEDVKQSIMDRKRDNSDAWQFSETGVGKRMLEKGQQELMDRRKRYASLDTSGKPEDVVRELIRLQTKEQMVAAQVSVLMGTEEIAKALDIELKKVNDAIRMREQEASTRRT